VTPALAGLLTGLSLIIAIGAQNAFVLRQGIRREHVTVVVAICALSDAVLIIAGTLGIGVLVTTFPVVLDVLKWGGVLYLLWFAFTSFRSALRTQGLKEDAARSAGSVVATTLALTWLNPHVYLDTVVMLGNLANQYGAERWLFAGGAAAGSVLWFTGLGVGARTLARPLARPAVWRVIDVVIGVVMVAIAVRLATL
jgi:L-lysine exporter family protein LysE/ArgO